MKRKLTIVLTLGLIASSMLILKAQEVEIHDSYIPEGIPNLLEQESSTAQEILSSYNLSYEVD